MAATRMFGNKRAGLRRIFRRERERSVCPSKAITAPAEWRSELKGFIIQTSQVAEAADNAFGPGTLNAGHSVSRTRRVPENWNERRAMYVHAERWTGWYCRVRVWFHFSSCSLSSSILRRIARPSGVIEMALRPSRSLISMKPWDCSN